MPDSEKEFAQYRRPIRRYHSLGGILGERGSLNNVAPPPSLSGQTPGMAGGSPANEGVSGRVPARSELPDVSGGVLGSAAAAADLSGGPVAPMTYGVVLKDSNGAVVGVQVSREAYDRMNDFGANQYGATALEDAAEESHAQELSRLDVVTWEAWSDLQGDKGFDVAERIWFRTKFLHTQRIESERVTVDGGNAGG